MQTKLIEVNKIKANINQPRIEFNDDSLIELAESIEENGLIQPITVRQVDDGYEIIAGERRFRAHQILGNLTIMANIIKKNDLESAKLALVENVQRENLSAIEEAKAYRKIIDETGITQQDLARQMGKAQSTIANKIRLLNLPDYIQDAVNDAQITERHARALLKVEEAKREKTFNKIISDGLNVSQTEKLITNKKEVSPKKKKSKSKIKGYSKNIKIGVNTITNAVTMCEKVGLTPESEIVETEDTVQVIVTFKK